MVMFPNLARLLEPLQDICIRQYGCRVVLKFVYTSLWESAKTKLEFESHISQAESHAADQVRAEECLQ